jgi:ABC-type glycerol-3-phosphate transport system permease component
VSRSEPIELIGAAGRTREQHARRGHPRRFAGTLICLVVGGVYLIPLVWVLSASLRSSADVFASVIVPHSFEPSNYREAWSKYDLGTLFLNTALITAGTVLLSLALSVTAAYGFSRYRSRLGEGLFLVILLGLMIPPAAIILPFFIAMNDLALYDKLVAVVLGETAFVLPLGILILRGYVDHIPTDLTDAALVDGAGEWRAFRHVAFPLLRPAVATVALLVTLSTWNGFLLPLVLFSDPTHATLTVGLASYSGQFGQLEWQLIAAASTMAVIPVLVVLFAARRYYVRGLAAGAVKG